MAPIGQGQDIVGDDADGKCCTHLPRLAPAEMIFLDRRFLAQTIRLWPSSTPDLRSLAGGVYDRSLVQFEMADEVRGRARPRSGVGAGKLLQAGLRMTHV